MMYVPKNSRRMRQLAKKQPIPIPPGKKFCYIEYDKPSSVDWDSVRMKHIGTPGAKLKRWFPSYGKAIAQLTKTKLNIAEDVEPWLSSTPCKIVEGCYTKGNKQQVTKETAIPNEHNRSEERDDSSGQPRPIRAGGVIPIPKGMGINDVWGSYQKYRWRSRSATEFDIAQRMDRDWYESGLISPNAGSYITSII